MGLSIIVAEFNPLTNGHKYIIEESKKLFPDNKIIVIMSGNFVQRGEPAIINKSARAEIAISVGADAVIELPTIFSLSSAEDFAYGAIKIASSFEGESTLIFGSECGDINLIKETEKKLRKTQNDPKIKENLKSGMSFASSQIKTVGGILERPNNLLGVMYLKAILDQNSALNVATIKREGDYNSTELNSKFASASAIRKMVNTGQFEKLVGKLPQNMLEKLNNSNIPSNKKLFSIIQYKLITTPVAILSSLSGTKEGIEYRITNTLKDTSTLEEFVEKISTKRYPETMVKRILMNILLDVTKDKKHNIKGNLGYFRILKVKDKAIYSELSKSKLTALTKKKDEVKLNEIQKEFLTIDDLADELYKILTK